MNTIKTRVVKVPLSEESHRRLRVYAAETDMSLARAAAEALGAWLFACDQAAALRDALAEQGGTP